MKVALVSSVFPPKIGGPSTQTYQLARSLRQRGLEPFVITFGPANGFSRMEGIPIHSLKDFGLQKPGGGPRGSAIARYINAYPRMKAVLQREGPDVLHHVSGPGYFAVVSGRLSRSLGIPSALKYAGDLVWERMARRRDWAVPYEKVFRHNVKTRLLTRLERYTLGLFDCIISPSLFQADSLVRILKVPQTRIVNCPNYVSLKGLNGSPGPRGKRP